MKILLMQKTKLFLIFILFIFVHCESPKGLDDGYGYYVFIPAGSFEMGDNFDEGRLDERPVHTVYLDAFYIGKYEVTNGEYKKFINNGGYTDSTFWKKGGFGNYGPHPLYWNNTEFRGGGIVDNENYPVVGLNWYEACAYCSWLSATTGKTYRLPTEAEWEKAARGMDKRKYPWGDKINGSYANYWYSEDPYDNGLTPVGFYDGSTHNGFKTHDNSSAYGAYDMAGNVWEFCSDWHNWYYYPDSLTKNPSGTEKGTHRAVRGGSWIDCAEFLRSSDRFLNYLPAGKDTFYVNSWIGFRCVREE